MKRLLSLGFLVAALAVAPLAAHANDIDGSIGVTLTMPKANVGSPAQPSNLATATYLTWTASKTISGTQDYSAVPVNTSAGSGVIYFGAGHLGGSASDGSTPFTFTIAGVGTFVATTDVFSLVQSANGALFNIDGIITPIGSYATAGYTATSADLSFAISKSGTVYNGGFTFTSPSPFSVTPEPSSIALLGTGLLGLAGVARRRIKA